MALVDGRSGLGGGGEVVEAVAGLPMAGFDDGQDCLYEAAALGALGAERQPAVMTLA